MREEWSCAKRRRRHWHCFRWQSLGFEAGWYSLGLADFELFFSWEFSRMVETRNLTKQEIVLNILCLLVNSGIDENDQRLIFLFPIVNSFKISNFFDCHDLWQLTNHRSRRLKFCSFMNKRRLALGDAPAKALSQYSEKGCRRRPW